MDEPRNADDLPVILDPIEAEANLVRTIEAVSTELVELAKDLRKFEGKGLRDETGRSAELRKNALSRLDLAKLRRELTQVRNLEQQVVELKEMLVAMRGEEDGLTRAKDASDWPTERGGEAN